jgi:hypothetical protein
VRRIAVAAAGVVLAAASLSAHRLDEYLQAARVTLGRSEVALEMDLTPGANVADAVIARVDRDGDDRIAPREAEAYGRAVLADVVLELDDRPVALTLVRVEVPPVDELRHGMGTIQLRASAGVERPMSRRPQLHFRNNHQPGFSVFLVNALVPGDAGVSVVRQTRDATQRDVRIDYDVRAPWPARLYWPLAGAVALLMTLFGFRSSFFVTRARIIPTCTPSAGG